MDEDADGGFFDLELFRGLGRIEITGGRDGRFEEIVFEFFTSGGIVRAESGVSAIEKFHDPVLFENFIGCQMVSGLRGILMLCIFEIQIGICDRKVRGISPALGSPGKSLVCV